MKMIGLTERPLTDCYTLPHADFTRRPRRIRPGDLMVLYAVGGSKRVFALAEVTSEIYDSGLERFPYRLDIRYLLNLRVASGVSIEQVSTPERELLRAIRQQASYFQLRPEEYDRAATLLRKASESGGSTESAATADRLGDSESSH
jgi:hypothetical protein